MRFGFGERKNTNRDRSHSQRNYQDIGGMELLVNPLDVITPFTTPGLFVTGTDTDVGKTMIACGIASVLRQQGVRVGVCKPVATGCERRREGLVSDDAELLAHAADSQFPLSVICPQCYAEPLAPAVAAERAGQPIEWLAVERSLRTIAEGSDVTIVEGVGGTRVPIDVGVTVIDLAARLALPAVVVARATLGTISHTLLTIDSLRSAGLEVTGVVINRYRADSASAAEETNADAIARWGEVPILAIVPDEPWNKPHVPAGVIAALVPWLRLSRGW